MPYPAFDYSLPPLEQTDPLVPLRHDLPGIVKLEILFDRYQPDYTVRLRQLTGYPFGQYSVTSLLTVLSETLVGVVLACESFHQASGGANAVGLGAHPYPSASAALTHCMAVLENGTFALFNQVAQPDEPAPTGELPEQPLPPVKLPQHQGPLPVAPPAPPPGFPR